MIINNRSLIYKRLSSFQKDLKKKPTLAEHYFYKLLKKNGIRFQFQRIFFTSDFRCIVDFYIKSDNTNIVIEIDGDYHLNKEQERKDNYRANWLKDKRRCRVIRFSNEQILGYPGDCLIELAQLYTRLVRRSNSNNFKIFKGMDEKSVISILEHTAI